MLVLALWTAAVQTTVVLQLREVEEIIQIVAHSSHVGEGVRSYRMQRVAVRDLIDLSQVRNDRERVMSWQNKVVVLTTLRCVSRPAPS